LTDPHGSDVGSGADSRRDVALRHLRHHPAPRFLVAGGVTFLVDIGSLRILHGALGVPLAAATVIAFSIAFLVNFTASRQWAFAATAKSDKAHRQLVRYLVLVGLNLASTLLIVVGLSAAGMNYLWAKVAAACVNAIGNFLAYRHWVFAAPPVL
jgi:putative flippase GtrA